MVTKASLEDDIRRMTENFEDEGVIYHTVSTEREQRANLIIRSSDTPSRS